MSPDADAVVMNRLEGRLREAERQRDRLAQVLKPFSALTISQCERCDGSGQDNQETKDACWRCGGTGEEVSMVLPEDVKAARAALAELEKP